MKYLWALISPAVVAAIFWADFAIWRLAHPDAPGWTYLFR